MCLVSKNLHLEGEHRKLEMLTCSSQRYDTLFVYLSGDFEEVLFLILLGEMVQFD